MTDVREEHRSGIEYLQAVTALLQRNRAAHPTAGLFEAADLQWWWAQRPRRTDVAPQLLWVDDEGRPVAAVSATAFENEVQLDPLVLPDATPEWRVHVMERGLAHAEEWVDGALCLEVDQIDRALAAALTGWGFACEPDGGLVETWLAAADRPSISPLAAGYRLTSRADHPDGPHPTAGRNHQDIEARLQQTSLYRADLDLIVWAADGLPAAHGLFWYDPVSATGLVEPMRTEDAHQRRGLARHVLTSGIDRLVDAGAERIKICFDPSNPASSHLYLDVGFVPARRNDRFTRAAAGA